MNNPEDQAEMYPQVDPKVERLQYAQYLEDIQLKLHGMNINNRIISIVRTKLEEAALWYAKLLREDD